MPYGGLYAGCAQSEGDEASSKPAQSGTQDTAGGANTQSGNAAGSGRSRKGQEEGGLQRSCKVNRPSKRAREESAVEVHKRYGNSDAAHSCLSSTRASSTAKVAHPQDTKGWLKRHCNSCSDALKPRLHPGS